jgi:hypothetical protein
MCVLATVCVCVGYCVCVCVSECVCVCVVICSVGNAYSTFPYLESISLFFLFLSYTLLDFIWVVTSI